MKDKFAAWAREVGVPTRENWTVEQICDAIVGASKPWPEKLSNEEGWQLWTAVMRRECAVQSIQWDELTSAGEETARTLEITFRLQDKREHKVTMPKAALAEREFGKICRELETGLREWKAADDVIREEQMRAEDEAYAARAPDLMEYVIGFRAWNLAGNRLKPIGAGGDIWDGGNEVRAICGNGALHRAPSEGCECGLYAWHSFEPMRHESGSEAKVFGAVQACGRLEIHREGFRAEYMRPVLLGYDDSQDESFVDEHGQGVVKRGPDFERVSDIAAQLGGIQVVPFDILEEASKEFGQVIPMDNPGLLP